VSEHTCITLRNDNLFSMKEILCVMKEFLPHLCAGVIHCGATGRI